MKLTSSELHPNPLNIASVYVITTGQPLSTMVSPEDEAAEADDPAKHENRSHRSPTTRREVDQAVEQPIAQPQEQLSQPQEQSAPTNEKPRRRFTELRYRTLNLPTLPEEHTNQDLKDWYTKLFKEDPMRYCPHDRKRLANEQRRCFNLVWDKSFAKEEEDLLDGFDSDDYDDDLSTQGNTNTDSDDYDNDDGNILDPVKLPRIFDIAIERLPRVIPNNASVITGNAENWLYLQKAERDLTLSEAQRDILKKANKEAKSELWKLAEKLIIRFHALYGVRQRKEFADCLSFMEWVLDYHSEQQQEVEEEQNNLEVLGNDIQSSRKELYILEFIMEEALIINNLAKVHQFVVTNGIEDIEAGKLLPKFIKRAEASYDF
ncbi:hypothetical protein QR680_000810 [Steinernema hermaphroditum]|uniref:Uncharacterized protein n=1 Tax=Steinernema hermaphroditum TaxID=289476 RepID=A0AA39GYR5_9BILA|nr:hypothetical protein QR680_000810 [Steinernema hermaphroditum]